MPQSALTPFICAYDGPTANQISVPEGSLVVTLSLKFNDSAAQVDHFAYHAPLGCPAFLILLVMKQDAKPRFGAKARFSQVENLARKALSACPDRHALDWQWKSVKYGGGHGNILMPPSPGPRLSAWLPKRSLAQARPRK